MSPLRKTPRYDDDELSDSGPVTLRSARFEVARAQPLPVEVVLPSGGRDGEERSGVRPTRELLEEASLYPIDSSADLALSIDDDLDALSADTEPVFDEDVILVDDETDEPDTVRMLPLDHEGVVMVHDTEPPPATLRSSQMRCAALVEGLERFAKGYEGKVGGAFGARPPSPPHAGGEARWGNSLAPRPLACERLATNRSHSPSPCLTPRVRGAGGPRALRSPYLPFVPLGKALRAGARRPG